MKSKANSDKFRSARFKLAIIYSLITFLVVVFIESSFFALYSRSVYTNFDTSIKNRALSIESSLVNYDLNSFEQLYSSDSKEKLFREPGEIIQIVDQGSKIIYSIGDFDIGNAKLTPNIFQTLYVQDVVDNRVTEIPIRTFVLPVQLKEETSVFLRVGKTYDSVKETVNSVLMSMLFITPLVLAIILFLAFKIANFALRPVEDSYKTLKQFTEDASHELKTPLAIIKTNVDVALSKKDGDLEYLKNKMELVNRVVNRISGIVSKMSFLSKLDSNSFKIQYEKVNVNSLIEEKIEEFKEISNAKNIKIEFSRGRNSEIISDSFSIGEILSNLLSNAITYTGEGGRIYINISDLENKLQISVSDTGVGISKDDIEHIFDRFYRSDKSRSRDTGGAGLGLSIVKNLVDLIGGTITVQSREGKGTTFSIYLPKLISK
jgi:signal transduction histidine kinase